MKLAYICSPYKGDVKQNIETAKKISNLTYDLGYIPICVHLFLEESTGLNENRSNREELLHLGNEILKKCQLIIVNVETDISEGMKQEIQTAKKLGIRRIDYNKEVFENDNW